jgi:hypothetical protein
VVPDLKNNWIESGITSLAIFILSSGVGLAFSNMLTRNNKLDKYLVSLALAISLVKVLGDGKKATLFMTGRVITKDIFKFFKRNNPVKNHHIYVCLSGFMAGLLGALVLALIAIGAGDTVQYWGYFLGGAGVVVGIVLFIVKLKSKKTV